MIVVNALFFLQTTNAQINLEHTFDGNVGHNGYFFAPLNYYTYYNVDAKQVRLYNENYSLYKQVVITPPANYSISSVTLFSKDIVTTDGKITFFVQFTNPNVVSTNPNSYSAMKLYDENGTVVKDFGYAYMFSPSFHQIADNKYRLANLRYIYGTPFKYQTDIYSLPGVPPVAPTIITSTLPDGWVGKEYSATLTAFGDAPIVWSLEGGNLPNGLNLSSSGEISGVPTAAETSNFTIKASNATGSDTKELLIYIDEETGVSVVQIAELKIFPNPTNGRLIVDCGNNTPIQIIFYDMTGKEVLNQNINNKTEINIGNLPKGIYSVSIISGNEVIGNCKIVKQ